ncbi:MAG: rRNA maturation RNase YbeY [Candidatus Omnitrophota bacterium]
MKIKLQNIQKKICLNQKIINEAIKKLEKIKLFKNYSFSVSLISNNQIKKINKDYHKKNYPTDVLSFEINQPEFIKKKVKVFDGDIIISVDTAKDNSKIYNKSIEEEILLYIIHGILHLTGFNDKTRKEAEIMHKKQEKILNKVIKIKNQG